MRQAPDGGDPRRPRGHNEREVLAVVRSIGPARAAAIVAASGLGRTAVEDLLAGLAARGWLVSGTVATGGRGRPARGYRFRAEAGFVAGLDVGAHGIRAVLTDLNGHVLGSTRVPVRPDTPREERLAAADAALDEVQAQAVVPKRGLWAVGVGTTGQVDDAGLVAHCPAIPDWTGVDLAGHFSRWPAPTVVGNDTRLAAVAEHRWGAAAGVDDFVLLQSGRTTGIAVVIGGRPRRGAHNGAADLSRLPFVTWESAVEVLHRCGDVPADVPLEDRAERVFAEARAGRPAALDAVREYAARTATAAAAAVTVVDPGLVVFGGGFSPAADVILPGFGEALARWCTTVPELRASTLGAACCAIGGAVLALEQVERRLLAPERGNLPRLHVNSLLGRDR